MPKFCYIVFGSFSYFRKYDKLLKKLNVRCKQFWSNDTDIAFKNHKVIICYHFNYSLLKQTQKRYKNKATKNYPNLSQILETQKMGENRGCLKTWSIYGIYALL